MVGIMARALIGMSTISEFSSSTDYNDYDSCTTDICSDGNCIHTPIDWHECGTIVTTSINPNEKAKELSWAVENIHNKRILLSSKTTLAANQTYIESKCLKFYDYNFIISCAANDAEQ